MVSVGYEELAGGLEPIRKGEIFWVNENVIYLAASCFQIHTGILSVLGQEQGKSVRKVI